jgi:hypothetical protein
MTKASSAWFTPARAASSAAANNALSLLAISEEYSGLVGSMNAGALSRPIDR